MFKIVIVFFKILSNKYKNITGAIQAIHKPLDPHDYFGFVTI